MSFNIRYGTANDGENHWDKRHDHLLQTIQNFHPDLLGTQETLKFQKDYLAEHLPDYESFGAGRDDGQDKGEMMALYYRRDRFEKLDSGHFWLSETPEQVGSKSWDAALPRMASWVKLRDKKTEGGRPILYVNTHFDHMGEQARLESAKLLRRQLVKLGDGCRLILTGDFNCGESSPPHVAMFDHSEQPSPVVDSYRVVHPDRKKDEGTFSAFRVETTDGPRIDWIGVSKDWKIQSAEIDHSSREGRTPSDHFPVTVVLE